MCGRPAPAMTGARGFLPAKRGNLPRQPAPAPGQIVSRASHFVMDETVTRRAGPGGRAGELVYGVLAALPRSTVAAACGARRSKQGFNANGRRWTQNTLMGPWHPHRHGLPCAVSAVQRRAGPGFIRVFCVHLFLHLR